MLKLVKKVTTIIASLINCSLDGLILGQTTLGRPNYVSTYAAQNCVIGALGRGLGMPAS